MEQLNECDFVLLLGVSVTILAPVKVFYSHKPSQTPMISIGNSFDPLSLGLGVRDVCENKSSFKSH
jgi:hypothetical protein